MNEINKTPCNNSIDTVVKGSGNSQQKINGDNEYTIFYVDDEEILTKLGILYLDRLGYNCITANSGQEALIIYKTQYQNIDLIILDLLMPGMNGEKTYKKLQEINPEVKIIITSGSGIKELKKKSHELNCQYITKPFDKDLLQESIKKALNIYK